MIIRNKHNSPRRIIYRVAIVVGFCGAIIIAPRLIKSWYVHVMSRHQPEAMQFLIFCIPFLVIMAIIFIVWCMIAEVK